MPPIWQRNSMSFCCHFKWRDLYWLWHFKCHLWTKPIAIAKFVMHPSVVSKCHEFARLKMKCRWQVLDCRIRLRTMYRSSFLSKLVDSGGVSFGTSGGIFYHLRQRPPMSRLFPLHQLGPLGELKDVMSVFKPKFRFCNMYLTKLKISHKQAIFWWRNPLSWAEWDWVLMIRRVATRRARLTFAI